MTRFMLDTNACVDLIRGRSAGMLGRLRRYRIDDVGISGITLAELHYGAARSSRPAHHVLLLAEFCAPLAILPFDSPAAEAYGMIRASLEREGTPIGPLDTLIAAHAFSLGVALVTANEREFRRIAGLRVENWLAL